MDEQKINIVVRKETNYGRELFYPVKEEDQWITIIQNQKSLTKDDINYLKNTGRFTFELQQEIL